MGGLHDLTASDHDLMLRLAGGDNATMDGMYRNRDRAFFRSFFRMSGRQAVSEDLVHEVFMRMFRYRHTYPRTNGRDSEL